MTVYRRIAQLKTADDFRAYLTALGVALPFDEELRHGPDAPLARPCVVDGTTIGNRFAILPIEGWDGTRDGRPTELTRRRWQRFGDSGAKLIWGGEAVAVRADGRANPHQLLMNEDTLADLADLRALLVGEHQQRFGRSDDLLVGLQLTHSGRFARPNEKDRLEPLLLYHHPLLDRKFVTGLSFVERQARFAHVGDGGHRVRLVDLWAVGLRIMRVGGVQLHDPLIFFAPLFLHLLELGLAHHVLNARREVARHPPDPADPIANGAHHAREFLGPDEDQREDRHERELGGSESEHARSL